MKYATEIFIFCENIRRLRVREGLSKEEMAKRLRIDENSLVLLEQGIVPNQLDCGVVFEIHRNFGILPKLLFSEIIE